MTYYKISQNGLVIGAGCTFLRWHPRKHRYFYCDIDAAECVQDAITEKLYHPEWLTSSPPGADPVEEAAVVIITASEYDDLIALLDDGESIPDEPAVEPEPISEPEPEQEERPMTVQEMREKIAEQSALLAAQDEQLQMLTDCILEMSEVVYGE